MPDKDNLQQIIAALKEEKKIHEPFAGMYEQVEGTDEHGYKIKANKEGLVELAIALLKVAREDYYHNGPHIIDIDVADQITSGDDGFLPEKIELSANPYVPVQNNKRKKSWAQRVLPQMGCLLILGFIVISLVTGIITVFRWIF